MRRIYVVESGWVFLADSCVATDAVFLLSGVSVIRSWGTTKGLGEIALNGPTKETVLDPCGQVDVPKGKVLFTIPCSY
jgi:hypothetical protein